MSSLGVVAVGEAQMIGGAGDVAGGGTGGLAHRYSHTDQLFGGQHLVQLSLAEAF